MNSTGNADQDKTVDTLTRPFSCQHRRSEQRLLFFPECTLHAHKRILRIYAEYIYFCVLLFVAAAAAACCLCLFFPQIKTPNHPQSASNPGHRAYTVAHLPVPSTSPPRFDGLSAAGFSSVCACVCVCEVCRIYTSFIWWTDRQTDA